MIVNIANKKFILNKKELLKYPDPLISKMENYEKELNYFDKNEKVFQYIMKLYEPDYIIEYTLIKYIDIIEDLNFFCLDEEIKRIYKTYEKINIKRIKHIKK